MKHKISGYSWLGAFLVLSLFLFLPVFRGLVPLPLNTLVGANYPWMDYRWGYEVGVPYKNASLTDVFSQLYLYRSIGINQIRQGVFSLWNRYSFSGMPFMGNFQAGLLYPLNFFMLFFGNLYGWTALVVIQILLSQILTYLYLRSEGLHKTPSALGGIIFSCSGYMMTNLEYVTIGHAFLWLPALLLIFRLWISEGKSRYLFYLPFLVYMQITSGSVYPVFYSFFVVFVYAIFIIAERKLRIRILFTLIALLASGMVLAANQLLPGTELLSRSIRFADQNITEHHYGLLPSANLLTFLAPDIFGNPATHNFSGFLGYQETSGYLGIVSLAVVISALIAAVRNGFSRFWLAVFTVCVVFAFSNPLSRLVYSLHIPLVSTWYASRLLLPAGFAGSILTAFGLDRLWSQNRRSLRYVLISGMAVLVMIAFVYRYQPVQIRNLIFPLLITSAGVIVTMIIKNRRLLVFGLSFLIILDLFRYYSKFTPFSKSGFDYPDTPVTEFLESHTGFFRVDIEKNSVLPHNTMSAYGLMTPSGYDPSYPIRYARFYDLLYNTAPDKGKAGNALITRYAQLTSYDSPFTDLMGVKYLVYLKKDTSGQIRPWGSLDPHLLSSGKYQQVFEDKSTVILQNRDVMPRAILYHDFQVEPDFRRTLSLLQDGFDFRSRVLLDHEISSPDTWTGSAVSGAGFLEYKSDSVALQTNSDKASVLVLTDSFFPGWTAAVDNVDAQIYTAFGIFRAVYVPPGVHRVVFKYLPLTFIIGSGLSLFGIVLMFYYRRYYFVK